MSSLTDLPELIGFFSYSREDDEGTFGALSALRERIQHELRAQLGRTAKTFRIWQDKEAIPSGTLWESEIKNSVAQAVFFIPIITPTVIASPYCRFELESFLAREAALGRDDLVFPILYIDVPALGDTVRRQSDPILSLIAKRQYVDWREFRYLDVNSTEVRRAVGRFCADIRDALHRPWLSPEEKAAAIARAEAERAETERRGAEARRAAEAQARERAEEERRRSEAEAEQRRKEEAEARSRKEEEAQRRREVEAERKVGAERRRAEEQRRREEAEANRYAEEEQRRAEKEERRRLRRSQAHALWPPSRGALVAASLLVLILAAVGAWRVYWPVAPTMAVAPTLTIAKTELSVNEHGKVPLGISETPSNPHDSVSITISGVPSDATLSAGTNNDNETWTLTPTQLGDLTLTAGAVTTANLTVTATNNGGQTALTSKTIALTVNPVAPKLTIANTELSVNEQGKVPLGISETPSDPHDSVSITISGVPFDATLSAGTNGGNGTWSLNPTQLEGLTLTAGAVTTANLTVTATNNGGQTASRSQIIALTVTEAPARAASPPPAATPIPGLSVAFGDTIDKVRAAYNIRGDTTEDCSSNDPCIMLTAPAEGLFFFFHDNRLDEIRADAPFSGSIGGVHIGDALDDLLTRFGKPVGSPFEGLDSADKAYLFDVNGLSLRCDITKAGIVDRIFIFPP